MRDFLETAMYFTIGVAINKFQVGSIQQIASEIGRISTVTMKTLINTGFKVILPALNSILAKHTINFPDNILGIFTLSNLDLAYYDEYIYFGPLPPCSCCLDRMPCTRQYNCLPSLRNYLHTTILLGL